MECWLAAFLPRSAKIGLAQPQAELAAAEVIALALPALCQLV